MANLDLNHGPADLPTIRRRVRRSGHLQQAQFMLAAAGLAALGILSVAGAILANLL
ncbi:hypothetical protein O9Z70_00785 [Devosia sp. YIM 151766]|uniref:hypothetical protein n=1 Tax=Devosia sp. YIM 151766 TaxID=3017325 RepID=UPI00255C7E48|nr:hypothetical protein [Devosia sp. YIM 151766]WIY53116.1 hypothetical protein O9Z70_00785 [Devosia sp. YIM 151766]